MKSLSLIVPCYNEEAILSATNDKLTAFLNQLIQADQIADSSSIIYVDDGSKDQTWPLIKSLTEKSSLVSGIKLSKNVGHQKALLAGLLNASGDILISIDADLQDDITAIERMLTSHNEGSEIVYGVRDDRTNDTLFKRLTAQYFYKIMAFLGIDIIYNHADYRLMSRRAIEALRDYPETNLFLRGIIPLIGLKTSTVFYKRAKRKAGESKYPLKRTLSLAWDGVTSLSVAPLRFVTAIGIIVFTLSILMSLIVISTKLFTHEAIPGWASTVLPIYLLGGIQILCIGILGEYLGKIYKEVKARPRYLIDKTCGKDQQK